MRINLNRLLAVVSMISVSAVQAQAASSWNPNDGGSSAIKKSSSRIKDTVSDVSPFSPGSHNLALDLGQVFLMGDLGKYTDSLGTQLHYSYGVSDLFAFDGSAGYNEHGDGRYAMASFLAGMRMNLSWYDKIIPFAVLGLGFYRPTYRDWTAPVGAENSTISAMLFGIHFGPGVDLEITKNLFFGASLTFHTLFGTKKELMDGTPLNLGGSYMSFLLHVGVTF